MLRKDTVLLANGHVINDKIVIDNMNYSFFWKGVCKSSEQNLEVTENIEVLLLTLDEVRKLLESCKIIEGIR